MPLFYKKYPNSIAATSLSIFSSTGLLFALLGVYEIYLGIERKSDDFFAGVIFLAAGILLKLLLGRAAEKVAAKKESKKE